MLDRRGQSNLGNQCDTSVVVQKADSGALSQENPVMQVSFTMSMKVWSVWASNHALMDTMALHCTLRFGTVHDDMDLMGLSEEVGSS